MLMAREISRTASMRQGAEGRSLPAKLGRPKGACDEDKDTKTPRHHSRRELPDDLLPSRDGDRQRNYGPARWRPRRGSFFRHSRSGMAAPRDAARQVDAAS